MDSNHVKAEDSEHFEEHEVQSGMVTDAAPQWSPLDKSIIRKTDWQVIPLIAMLYLLSFLDRANVGNARVAGLQDDLALSDHQYHVAITVTYVPYICAEIPSNLIIKKVGPQIWLSFLCFAWGVISTLQCLMHNYEGFIACRFFLGLAEGGLYPGIILYLTTFYRRKELSLRIAFVTIASLSGAFSGLLAAAISKMDGLGGMEGWRWIFAMEGIFTVCWAVFTYFVLPNTPQDVRFLTAEEKARCIERLQLDAANLEAKKVHLRLVFSVFKDLHLLLPWICCFCTGSIMFGLAYFVPSIVKDMGFAPIQTQLMSVPPYAWAFTLTVIVAFFSDKFQKRGIPVLITYFIALAGSIMFLTGRSFPIRYSGLFLLLGGIYAGAPVVFAWVSNNCASHTRRATSVATASIFVNIGAIISTWIFPRSDAPYYLFAAKFLLSLNVIGIVAAASGMMVCAGLNRKKEDPAYREKLLRNVENLTYPSQLEKLGDHHPDFKYLI